MSIAERGYCLTAVEIGPALVERGRTNLAGYPNARVVCARFEDLDPDTRARLFDGLADLIHTRYRGLSAQERKHGEDAPVLVARLH